MVFFSKCLVFCSSLQVVVVARGAVATALSDCCSWTDGPNVSSPNHRQPPEDGGDGQTYTTSFPGIFWQEISRLSLKCFVDELWTALGYPFLASIPGSIIVMDTHFWLHCFGPWREFRLNLARTGNLQQPPCVGSSAVNESCYTFVGRRFVAALLPRLFGTNPRSHHKGATGRFRTGDQRLPALCHCQLDKTSLYCSYSRQRALQ